MLVQQHDETRRGGSQFLPFNTMKHIAVDTETFLIGPGKVCPKIVCVSFAWRDEEGELHSDLKKRDDALEPLIELFEDEEVITIWANGAFDLTVMLASYTDDYTRLYAAMIAALRAGRVVDVQHREKLLNLSTHGKLDKIRMPDGHGKTILYRLSQLEKDYLGWDRTDQKDDEDAWRVNYDALDGWEISEYPEDAAEYAKDDALGTYLVFEAQEKRVAEGDGQVETQDLQARADWALRLYTAWGIGVDQDEVKWIRERCNEELHPSKMELLVEWKILRPGSPPRPHSAKHRHKTGPLAGQIKMTAAVPPSINQAELKKHVVDMCVQSKIPVHLTDKGREDMGAATVSAEAVEGLTDVTLSLLRTKYAATDADFIAKVAGASGCPVLGEFQHRQSLQKITTGFLPRMEGHDVVHIKFDVLKETTRTSSVLDNLFPSIQGQNVPRLIKGIDVRRAIVPRPGRTIIAADYSGLELGCVGQQTWDLFGDDALCQHRALINAGVDLHSWLAVGMVLEFGKCDVSQEFQNIVRETGGTKKDAYQAFKILEEHGEEELRNLYEEWRQMAKPVGLGFPGGMGPTTMAEQARKSYGVHMSIPQCTEFREIWRETYPEMVPFFAWINEQGDPLNRTIGVNSDTGRSIKGYYYESPLGMIRRGASYCAAANGSGMQTRGAEGAKMSVFEVADACYNPAGGSVLFGCHPWNFVHDENLLESTEEQELWHEQAMELSRIMEEQMDIICPDVKIKADPLLSAVWSKKAKPVLKDGRLTPWTPEPHEATGSRTQR